MNTSQHNHKEKKVKIILSKNHPDAHAFARWLAGNGHYARVGDDQYDIVDGCDGDSPSLFQLWNQCCEQPKIPGSIISDVQYDGCVADATGDADAEFKVADLVADLEKIWGDQ